MRPDIVNAWTRQSARILLADERPDHLEAIACVAKRLGHTVSAVQTNLAGVAALIAAEPFDVAIVAVDESSQHGLALVARIAQEAMCPVIVLLDVEDPAFVHEAAKRGVFAYLTRDEAGEDQLESAMDVALHRFAEYHALQSAFGRRALSERAKGVLMERHSIDERAATDLLRERARAEEREVLDVAQAVLDMRALLPEADLSHDGESAAATRRLAMLERAAEIAGIGSFDSDIGSGEQRWSDNLFRLFGLEPGAHAPSPEYVFERMHVDDRARVRLAMDTAARVGRPGTVEYRIARSDGAVRRMQATFATVQTGPSLQLTGTVQDVTDRRQIAREIEGHLAMDDVLATWVSFDVDAPRLLARLGEAKGFSAGTLWLPQADLLEARSRWSYDGGAGSPPDADLLPITDGPRHALPVQAWLTRQPVVVVDLSLAQAFPGRDAAVRSGLRGALAFAAVNGASAFAVLEFYSRERLHPTETVLRSLTGMGHELGHFFAHRTGELRPQELTARERQMLQLAAEGMSGRAIAEQLTLSPSTVKTHFENIYAKWGVSDRPSAVAKALREGLIT